MLNGPIDYAKTIIDQVFREILENFIRRGSLEERQSNHLWEFLLQSFREIFWIEELSNCQADDIPYFWVLIFGPELFDLEQSSGKWHPYILRSDLGTLVI